MLSFDMHATLIQKNRSVHNIEKNRYTFVMKIDGYVACKAAFCSYRMDGVDAVAHVATLSGSTIFPCHWRSKVLYCAVRQADSPSPGPQNLARHLYDMAAGQAAHAWATKLSTSSCRGLTQE